MIEQIEEVSRESRVHSFADCEVLEQREVYVPGSCTRVEGSGVGIGDVRNRCEASRAVGQYNWQIITEV